VCIIFGIWFARNSLFFASQCTQSWTRNQNKTDILLDQYVRDQIVFNFCAIMGGLSILLGVGILAWFI
jgi:hypothetical protein